MSLDSLQQVSSPCWQFVPLRRKWWWESELIIERLRRCLTLSRMTISIWAIEGSSKYVGSVRWWYFCSSCVSVSTWLVKPYSDCTETSEEPTIWPSKFVSGIDVFTKWIRMCDLKGKKLPFCKFGRACLISNSIHPILSCLISGWTARYFWM